MSDHDEEQQALRDTEAIVDLLAGAGSDDLPAAPDSARFSGAIGMDDDGNVNVVEQKGRPAGDPDRTTGADDQQGGRDDHDGNA